MPTTDAIRFDPAFFADPYPTYRRLRAEDPVHEAPDWGGVFVTRYDDVAAALQDPRLSLGDGAAALFDGLDAEEQREFQPIRRHISRWIGTQDPPGHTRLRALMARAFTPRLMQDTGPLTREVAAELVEAAVVRGSMDVVRDLAYPLPAVVIATILGTPPEDRDRFKAWSADITAMLGGGPPRVESIRQAQASVLEMTAYLADQVRLRREEPGHDLISGFIAAEAEGSIVDEEEFLANCVLLLFAGHETTTMLIANGLRALLDQPEAIESLRESPELLATAVEEFLRYDSPVQIVRRRAREGLRIGGRAIGAGQLVWLVLGSANRDGSQFDEPDRLDIRRERNRHLAFGAGVHYCLGAALSRLEARIAFETLLGCLDDIRLAGRPPAWAPNPTARMLTSLEIAFRPSQATPAVTSGPAPRLAP